MDKTIVPILVLVLVGVGGYYVVKGSDVNKSPATTLSPITESRTTAQSSSVEKSGEVTITIKNSSFNPPMITVKPGTKITWVNEDAMSHTVTSDSGKLIDSKELTKGKPFGFMVGSAGEISYHCSIHPTMKGKIIVAN